MGFGQEWPLPGSASPVERDPTLLGALCDVHMELRPPTFALSSLTLNAFLVGAIFLCAAASPPDARQRRHRLRRRRHRLLAKQKGLLRV